MPNGATTVEQYLASLPEERRTVVQAVRQVILANLDAGYAEGMQYGMIGYFVPHEVFPPGYHSDPRQPLPFAAIASQKNHLAIYLFGIYADAAAAAAFADAWRATGRKLDMGKSCVRFKTLDDVALDVLGDTIRGLPVANFIERYQSTLAASRRPPAGKAGTVARSAGSRSRATKPVATRPAKRKPGPKRPGRGRSG